MILAAPLILIASVILVYGAFEQCVMLIWTTYNVHIVIFKKQIERKKRKIINNQMTTNLIEHFMSNSGIFGQF